MVGPCVALLMSQGMDFDRAGGMLQGTMKRLGTMMRSGGTMHMCYLAIFSFFVFVLLYWILRSKSSL